MVGSKVLVSVVIPMFNAESFIEEAIDSVIKQTYNNWEIIVVDDFSTDNSKEIVEKLSRSESRIQLIGLKRNSGGPATPRNIGMANANADYVAFLDADDVWLPGKLEKQVLYLNENPEIDICHTLAYAIDANGDVYGIHRNQRSFRFLNLLMPDDMVIFYTCHVNINTALMRSCSSISFDKDENLSAVEDWNFWIENRLGNRSFGLIAEPLIKYRVLEESISNRASNISYKKALYMISRHLARKNISFRVYLGFVILQTIKIVRKKVIQ